MAVSIVAVPAPAGAQEPRVEVVLDGLEFPTGIAFSPDGTLMYVNERAGRVRVVESGELRPQPLATIPTTTDGETGLLGIDVAPDGSELYVFATDPEGGTNRVLTVPSEGGAPDVLVDGLPASLYHNGGGIAVDEDGLILVSNGEVHDSSNAQDPSTLGGKIYRFTPDGAPAAGNPFGPSIALGLRNPYGMTLDPVTGDAFVTENGPTFDDEVNRIRVGGNYGWPEVLGRDDEASPSGPGEYHDPLFVHEEIVVPTGIAVADPAEATGDVAGDVFYGTYGEPAIHRIELDDAREKAITHEIFIDEDEPVVALEWGPGGLYYSTTSAIKLVRLARPSPPPGKEKDRGTESPEITGPPLSPDPDSENPLPLIVFGIVSIVVGLGALAIARRRRT